MVGLGAAFGDSGLLAPGGCVEKVVVEDEGVVSGVRDAMASLGRRVETAAENLGLEDLDRFLLGLRP